MMQTSLLDLEAWAAIGPPLANHLWQSTLFVALAGILVLLLRKNHARARYWLWLAVSVKFLVPFSLLVGIGSQLGWTTSAAIPQNSFAALVEPVSHPFGPIGLDFASPAAAPATLPRAANLLPVIVVATWVCGCLAVLISWWSRWRRVTAAIRSGMPLRQGRELSALRHVERIGGIRSGIELVLSRCPMEPGVFGILRPVLLWPAEISDHLADEQIEAIIAHELCHVRRRDNLTSAIHMTVEAIFWFHPLVWWLGARLVDERERACDEEVLRLGSEPQVYAESILRTCEFSLRSPLVCVAGVTGSDLKKRIERIMTHAITHKLNLGRKLVLATVGIIVVAVPILFGIANNSQGRAQSDSGATFEVASIRPAAPQTGIHQGGPAMTGRKKSLGGVRSDPGRVTATNITLRQLLQRAYKVRSQQVTGPSWLDSDRFDIAAKLPEGATNDQVPVMLQNLIIERFKLALHLEKKEMPVYALVVGKNGPKLEKAEDGESAPGERSGINFNNGSLPGWALITAYRATLSLFADSLTGMMDRPVIDETGMEGKYNFAFEVAAEDLRFLKNPGAEESGAAKVEGGPAPDSTPGPSIFSALQKIGLKLEPRKAPLDFIVIDKGERVPTEN